MTTDKPSSEVLAKLLSEFGNPNPIDFAEEFKVLMIRLFTRNETSTELNSALELIADAYVAAVIATNPIMTPPCKIPKASQ